MHKINKNDTLDFIKIKDLLCGKHCKENEKVVTDWEKCCAKLIYNT